MCRLLALLSIILYMLLNFAMDKRTSLFWPRRWRWWKKFSNFDILKRGPEENRTKPNPGTPVGKRRRWTTRPDFRWRKWRRRPPSRRRRRSSSPSCVAAAFRVFARRRRKTKRYDEHSSLFRCLVIDNYRSVKGCLHYARAFLNVEYIFCPSKCTNLER